MKECQLIYHAETQVLQCILHQAMTSDDLFQLFHCAKKQRHLFYMEKRIQRNGISLARNTQCFQNDVLSFMVETTPDPIPAWFKSIEIIYEDDLVLVVNKPAHMIVHSDGQNTTHTLNNCVQAYYNQRHITLPVRPIHRLDQDTTGLVMYCKLPFLQPYLDFLLQEKQIERIYKAWVKGSLTKESIVDQPIARDRHNAKKMRVSPSGAAAYTIMKPIKQIENATLVECHLKTGRTHQIRVHLAYLHHPILSDPLYGTKDPRIHRCALHAWKLCFVHPFYDKQIELVCDLPDDMNSL